MDDTLLAIHSNPDTYEIGLAWSAYYTTIMTTNRYNVKTDSRLNTKAVGDGIVNDHAAIQSAMNLAGSNGGGVVYLPAGTYKCEDSGFVGLDIPTNIVLQGAGKTSTIVTYGTGPRVEKFTGSYQKLTIGICDLTMKCIDTSGAYAAGLFDQVKNIFFKNVRWELQRGARLEVINCKKVAIINCEFFQRDNPNYHGPTTTTNCEYLTIKGTTLTFVTTGINTIGSSKCFIEGNTLIRDISIPMPAGSIVHLMTCDFMPKALIANNKFLLANGPIPRGANGLELNNDGETIISEGGGAVIPDLDYGQVTSATISTLTNDSKNWPVTFNRKPMVAIIKGKGAGQVRKIVSRTNTTLTLDTTWDIVPDNTSSYSIFNWALEQVAFVNNEIQDQQRGIYMYHNAMHHVDIIENKLIDSGAINIEPIQQIRSNGVHQFIPVYNIEIVGNYVDGANDPYNGVSIGVNSIQFGVFQSWGTICTNLRISRNTLIGAVPNKDVTQHRQFPSGYHAYALLQASFYQDDGVPVILGTILCDNTAKDLKKAIFINSGSYHTSVSRTIQINSPDLIDNQLLPGTNHGGVSIVTL
ncbi:hypothetical protein GCM10027423_20860 [Spirosoma arcticum]